MSRFLFPRPYYCLKFAVNLTKSGLLTKFRAISILSFVLIRLHYACKFIKMNTYRTWFFLSRKVLKVIPQVLQREAFLQPNLLLLADNNERALSTHCEFFSLTLSQINSPLLLQWMCKYLMESPVCPCLHCYFACA